MNIPQDRSSPLGVDELSSEGVLRRRKIAKEDNDEPPAQLFNNNKEQQRQQLATPIISSGVTFYPPSKKYWRINQKWYDFTTFLNKHPGGAEVLLLSRDRFEDSTYIFESHHLNYKKVRKIIAKYEVDYESVVLKNGGVYGRPNNTSDTAGKHTVHSTTPTLLNDTAFYSVMRTRVHDYLKSINHTSGGPTIQCKIYFWITFISWICSFIWLVNSASILSAITTGFTASWLGAFGHNFVHQPKYKFWAYLSLDTIGFASDAWFREHNLQHHMYTNTPWDNHFEGSAPWLITDPTIERNLIQKYIMPYINPILLSFGLYTNYLINILEILKGNDKFTLWRLCLPFEIGIMIYTHGVIRGGLLMYLSHAILGVYYFTMALMNHNAEHCLNVKKRNAAKDWGEAQLISSADWGVGMSFYTAIIYLWLNYHTVHHLFPLVDFSHHPAIQEILIKTCEEFELEYIVKSPIEIYKEMVRTFSSPTSLMQEIRVYGGGL